MDAEPPNVPEIEHVRPVEDVLPDKGKRLIIDINDAHYDPETGVATITLRNAWFKASRIWWHNGDDITLRYKGQEIDLDSCPEVAVPTDNIQMNTNFWGTKATIEISGVATELAADIQEQNCLVIDTDTVKDVLKNRFEKPAEEPDKPEP